MKISHEIPKQLFPVHDLINDYPYVLAHLLSDQYHYDKEYAEFYKNKLQGCEFSILDNSCLDYYSNILLADGSKEKLGVIVKKKLAVNVLSYNKENRHIESKPVLNWFDNGMGKTDWYKIIYKHSKVNRKDRVGIRCTGNHKIFTKDRGYIQARELKVGDRICSNELLFNRFQKQLILGAVLGDSNIKKCSGSSTARSVIRIGHSDKQKEYVEFKHGILLPFARSIYIQSNNHPKGFNKRKNAKLFIFETHALMQLNEINNSLYPNKNKIKTYSPIIDQLDWFGFCIWYLDDGSTNITNTSPVINISLAKITEEDRIRIPIALESRFGLKSQIKNYRNNVLLIFNKESTDKIFQNIEHYIPKCMDYKIHPKCYKKKNKVEISNACSDIFEVQIETIINKGFIRKKKYDITVESNHNYFADNILVSNCYELGQSIDTEILYQLGEEYKPSHIVIPDMYGQFKPTLELVSEYSDKFGSKSTPKFFAVVQGQNLEEYVNCFEAYLKDSFIDLIGITFRSLKDGTTRESFLKHIFHFYNIYPKKIHLLGCSYPNEFLNMETKLLKNVYSVDTSSPIIHGWNGNAFTPQGCIYDKPKEKLADNLNIYLDEKQVQLIYKNINHFRNYFK